MLNNITFEPSGRVIEDSILVNAYNEKDERKNLDVAIILTKQKMISEVC